MAQTTLPDNDKAQNDGVAKTPDELEDLYNQPSYGEDTNAEQDSQNSEPIQKTPLRVRLAKRKKFIIGAGVGGGVIGLTIAAFIALLPLKLEGIVKNISSRAFAATENAIDHRAERLMEHYVAKSIFPGIKACGSTRNPSCGAANLSTNTIAGRLFENWRQGKFEQKLWEQHGIAFEYDNRGGGKYSIITGVGSTDIADPDNFKINMLQTEARTKFRHGVRETTKWYQVYKRHGLRKMGRTKYGFTRWNVFGNQRDEIRTKYNPAQRVKMATVRRLITPLSERYGVYLSCIIEGCGNNSEFRKKLSSQAAQEAAEEVVEDLTHGERGRDFIIRKSLEPLLAKFGVKIGINAVPVAGQVIFAVLAVDMIDRVDEAVNDDTISRYAADLRTFQYATDFLDAATFSDEMKSGQLKFDEVGAKLEQVGNPGQSRIYQRDLMGKTAATPSVVCEDGQELATEEVICPEKKVAQRNRFEKWRDNSLVDGVISYGLLGNYRRCYGGRLPVTDTCIGVEPRREVRNVIPVVDKISEGVFRAVTATIRTLGAPFGINEFMDSVENWAKEGFLKIAAFFFAPVITPDDKDAVAFDNKYIGGMIVGRDFATGDYHEDGTTTGTGGKTLTLAQAQANQEKHLATIHEQEQSQSLLARLFSPNVTTSITSVMAMGLPTDTNQIITHLASLPGNLVTFVAALFAPPVSAQTAFAADIGVLPSGYPLNDPDLDLPPETLTPDWCANRKAERERTKQDTDNDGIDEYTMTDPCMLEAAAVDSLGAVFTTDAYEDGATGTVGGTVPAVGDYAFLLDKSAVTAESELSDPHHDYPAWDYGIPVGTPIYAIAGGTVRYTSRGNGCGTGLIISSGDGVNYTYCHGSSWKVADGAQVAAGQLILLSGNTGRSSGPHIHLGISINGAERCPQQMLMALYKGEQPPSPASLPSTGCYYTGARPN